MLPDFVVGEGTKRVGWDGRAKAVTRGSVEKKMWHATGPISGR